MVMWAGTVKPRDTVLPKSAETAGVFVSELGCMCLPTKRKDLTAQSPPIMPKASNPRQMVTQMTPHICTKLNQKGLLLAALMSIPLAWADPKVIFAKCAASLLGS
jgi:hypothetical protein